MFWKAVIFGPEDTPWEGGASPACGASARLRLLARSCACVAPACRPRLRRCVWHTRAGTFKLTLTFTEDYPNKAPTVRFESKMFHPNSARHAPQPSRPFFDRLTLRARAQVYADGGICLDILQNNWSPIYDVSAVLTSIQSLLCDPNPNSPANSEAARMYTECRCARSCAHAAHIAAADLAPAADGSTTSAYRRALRLVPCVSRARLTPRSSLQEVVEQSWTLS